MNDSDVVGKTFGRWFVICRNGNAKNKSKQYLCRCKCGVEKNVIGVHLLKGNSTSCGCYSAEQSKKRNTKHGQSKTRLFNIWQGMKNRCYLKSDKHYQWYGARGIRVCKEWQNNFETFWGWAVSNGYEKDKSIDRIDNNGNYEPSNCRWVDHKTQCRNRRSNLLINIDGQIKPLIEWCEIKGFNYKLAWGRYRRGIPVERIFEKKKSVDKK
jgi:hypothetical protein